MRPIVVVQPLAHASAGVLSTIVHDGVMTPFDVAKQRMQMDGSSYRSFVHCLTSVVRTEGVAALYVALPTTVRLPFMPSFCIGRRHFSCT